MRAGSLAWVAAAIAAAAAANVGSGPALAAAGSTSAIVVYDCASVDFNPGTAAATGHRCARGDDGAPDLVGYALFDNAQAEEYGCKEVSTTPDPEGGLVVSGTGCERVIAP